MFICGSHYSKTYLVCNKQPLVFPAFAAYKKTGKNALCYIKSQKKDALYSIFPRLPRFTAIAPRFA
jgi:hypothetical protein